jgi:hypothetical protein
MKLKNLTKEQLFYKLCSTKSTVSRLQRIIVCKNAQLKNFRMRLLKIRNEFDYMLVHPYSIDTNLHGRKHRRDNIHFNQRSKYYNK